MLDELNCKFDELDKLNDVFNELMDTFKSSQVKSSKIRRFCTKHL